MTRSYPTKNFCQVISLVAALCLACVSSPQSSAQDAAPPSRPDTQPQLSGPPAASRKPVGLALSGGGALGLAHIGVLRWLEEHHIPVDRIAGTSMGGIIAALYATGRSPAEIEKFAEDIDWDQALLPEPDYDQLSFRRKQDRRNYQIAAALGLKPRARFHSFAVAGTDPVTMLKGPIPVTKKILEKSGLSIDDIDVFEVNEAFASVVLAWQKETGADMAKVNVNGGAIALGHPLGGSGTKLMATLLNELERTGGRYGMQVMCEGGGMANATIIERIES